MGEVIPRFQLRWPVISSVALHGAVALLLVMRISAQKEVVPLGIEMLYLGEVKSSSPASASAVKAAPRIAAAPKPTAQESATTKTSKDQAMASSEAAVQTSEPGLAGRQDGSIVSAIERYKYELRLFLEGRKIYPETARRLRQTGKVVVNFKISATGDLSEINLEQSSGSEILNRAAVELVKGAPRFKPIPTDSKLSEMKLSLPIEYVL